MKFRITRKTMNYILLAVFMLLTLLGNFTSSVLLFGAVLVAVMVFFTGDDEDNFGFALFMLPIIRIFDATGITFFANILMTMPLLIRIFRGKKIYGMAILQTALLAAFEVIHIIASDNYSNLFPNIAAIIALMYCQSASLDNETNLDTGVAARYLGVGSLFSAVVYLLVNRSHVAEIVSMVSSGARFIAYASDPNYYSIYLCISMALLFSLKKHRWYDYILLPMVAIIGLLTASKMCFILIILTLVLYGIANMINGVSTGRGHFYFRIVAVGLVGVAVFFNNVKTLVQNLISRAGLNYNTVNLHKLTTGRSDIVFNYMDILTSNFKIAVFGAGMQYSNRLHMASISHNTYLDVILSWGIIGVIATLLIFTYWFRRIRYYFGKPDSVSCYFPILILGVSFFALSCLSASMFWLIITAAMLPLRNSTVKAEENKNE